MLVSVFLETLATTTALKESNSRGQSLCGRVNVRSHLFKFSDEGHDLVLSKNLSHFIKALQSRTVSRFL